MPPAYLAAALDAIDPFLTGQAVSLEQGGGDEEDVSGRAVWVASIDCLAALAQAGVCGMWMHTYTNGRINAHIYIHIYTHTHRKRQCNGR